MAAHNPRSHEADRHAHERELLAELLHSTGIGLQLDCASLCMLHPSADATLPKDSALPATASPTKRTARAARHDAGLRLRTQDASTYMRQLTEPTTTPRTRPHHRFSLTQSCDLSYVLYIYSSFFSCLYIMYLFPILNPYFLSVLYIYSSLFLLFIYYTYFLY